MHVPLQLLVAGGRSKIKSEFLPGVSFSGRRSSTSKISSSRTYLNSFDGVRSEQMASRSSRRSVRRIRRSSRLCVRLATASTNGLFVALTMAMQQRASVCSLSLLEKGFRAGQCPRMGRAKRSHCKPHCSRVRTLKPWRPAREIIDWQLKGKNIFARKKPLAEKTLKRIAAGMKKINGLDIEPFLVMFYGTNKTRSIEQPLPTVTANGQHIGLCEPFLLSQASGGAPRPSRGTCTDDLRQGCGTDG